MSFPNGIKEMLLKFALWCHLNINQKYYSRLCFIFLTFLFPWFVFVFCDIAPWQPRRILNSIYGMTQQMRCQRSGKQQPDLEKPLESMKQLIIHNCSPGYLVRQQGL